ncbi:MAG: leucyl aminopeptidase [Candidatus Cloacimonadota bacterium]|nr:leucyl aminopeptidase [Candidatus Cloacimonadota bacterium]
MKIDVCRKLPEHIETLVYLQFEDEAIQVPEVLGEDLISAIENYCTLEEYTFNKGSIKSFTRMIRKKKQLIILCGAGKKAELDSYSLRNLLADCWREATRNKARQLYLMFGFVTKMPEPVLGHLLSESALLSAYKFNKYLSSDKTHELECIHLIYFAKTNRHLNRGILEGRIFAEATNLARDLVNEPANVINPESLADYARKAALQYGFSLEVHSIDKIKRLKMEALLAVGRGSKSEPKLIIMRYNGNPDKKNKLTALVGKGLTFDSGGYSLKPSNSMLNMKSDMGGAAAVIGAFSAIATLKLKVNVVGIIAAAENMIGSSAYRPGDVITSMSGKTIEVVNTDAEGRLTLIDAIHFALEKEKADKILDIATLTGAAVAALGKDYSAVLSNDDAWYAKLEAASTFCGEKIWRMPLHDPYKELIKSEIADLKNAGGPLAGCITAALFIQEFVQNKPWIHIDIAGGAMRDKVSGINSFGATGVGVRLLIALLKNME